MVIASSSLVSLVPGDLQEKSWSEGRGKNQMVHMSRFDLGGHVFLIISCHDAWKRPSCQSPSQTQSPQRFPFLQLTTYEQVNPILGIRTLERILLQRREEIPGNAILPRCALRDDLYDLRPHRRREHRAHLVSSRTRRSPARA